MTYFGAKSGTPECDCTCPHLFDECVNNSNIDEENRENLETSCSRSRHNDQSNVDRDMDVLNCAGLAVVCAKGAIVV